MEDEDDLVVAEAVIEQVNWGRATYTVIVADPRLVAAAREWPTRRVAGWIDDVPVNVGINHGPPGLLPGPFFYAAAPLRARLGKEPGDTVVTRLRPVPRDDKSLPTGEPT